MFARHTVLVLEKNFCEILLKESKFEHYKDCKEVDGCTDANAIVNKFVDYFSKIYSCNNLERASSLQQEFTSMYADYYGFSLTEKLFSDTELVSKIISNLKTWKST